MKLYWVDDEYVEFLRKEDHRVLKNKKTRPYLGVVLEINGINYYVPLSSVKEKKRVNTQLTMKVIDERGDVIGYLQFLNMIPVDKYNIKEVDLEKYKNKEPKHYQLLVKEIIFIRGNIERIKRQANRLYKQRHDDSSTSYRFFDSLCCNYKKLEEVYTLWVKEGKGEDSKEFACKDGFNTDT